MIWCWPEKSCSFIRGLTPYLYSGHVYIVRHSSHMKSFSFSITIAEHGAEKVLKVVELKIWRKPSLKAKANPWVFLKINAFKVTNICDQLVSKLGLAKSGCPWMERLHGTSDESQVWEAYAKQYQKTNYQQARTINSQIWILSDVVVVGDVNAALKWDMV